jgi:type III secretion protein U
MAEKTEQPTDKKQRDSAKKGQSWKAQDFIVLLVTISGAAFIRFVFPPGQVAVLFDQVLNSGFEIPMGVFATEAFAIFVKWSALTLLAVLLPATLPSLILSRFRWATEAVKIDFKAVNPVSGFKKIFSIRNAKNAVKALLYLSLFLAGVFAFWEKHKHILLASSRMELGSLILVWADMAWALVLYSLGAILLLVVLDMAAEFALYIKDLKMTKDEVKREYKDTQGDPEIKGRRRQLAHEMLNEIQKAEVSQSSFVLANPTHIAIGIYVNRDITEWPFISIVETNARALAVIAYAEKVGVPVIRNVLLTRGLFRTAQRYEFVDREWLFEVVDVLTWLRQVEAAANGEDTNQEDANKEDDASNDTTGSRSQK